MQAVGIELAASADQTAVAVLEWSSRAVRLEWLSTGASDTDLIELLCDPRTDVAGLTAPVGWPEATARPMSVEPSSASAFATRRHRELRSTIRATDRWLLEQLSSGRHGFGIGPARFGAAALRTYDLLEQLPAFDVDRTGRRGKVVEVRPHAALRAWRLPYSGYDLPGRDGQDLLDAAVAALSAELGLSPAELDIEDAAQFDALVAGLVAGMSRNGLTEPVPEDLVNAAIVEGWVQLPTVDSLAGLYSEPLRVAS